MLLTRPPLVLLPARLACMRHAINVRSEPGSNSPLILYNLWSETFGWLADVVSTLGGFPSLLSPCEERVLESSLLMTGHRP